MDKEALLALVALARKKAEQGDAAIAAQLIVISDLERDGLDPLLARDLLDILITARDTEVEKMEKRLDEMDNG